MRRSTPASVLLLSVLAMGCGPDEPEILGPLAEEGTRHEIAEVTFNLWVDYIPLFGATDPECRWIDPAISDDTTPWPPMQAFWVIYEESDDVEITSMSDVFFEGDEVSPADFERREGLDALGFLPFSGFQANLLDVTDLRRDADGYEIEADFGPPVEATLRITSAPDGDGGCAISTEYCETGACSAGFAPLERIHLDLGFLYAVQDIRFE
jgi:hypothetical protein